MADSKSCSCSTCANTSVAPWAQCFPCPAGRPRLPSAAGTPPRPGYRRRAPGGCPGCPQGHLHARVLRDLQTWHSLQTNQNQSGWHGPACSRLVLGRTLTSMGNYDRCLSIESYNLRLSFIQQNLSWPGDQDGAASARTEVPAFAGGAAPTAAVAASATTSSSPAHARMSAHSWADRAASVA